MCITISVKTIPVCTSVTFTLYSRITPFDKEGGDHDSDIDREVTLVPVTFCGALGAEIKKYIKRKCFRGKLSVRV